MSDSVMLLAFDSNGGLGKRITATTSSSSGLIPRGQGDTPNICITNGGSVSAFFRLGQSDVVATLDCQELLPGCCYVFGVEQVRGTGQAPLYMAVITESSTTKIQATLGRGT